MTALMTAVASPPPLPAATPSNPLSFLYNARVAKWEYPRNITTAQAADYATSQAQAGINLLLTEGHRSLVNDWPTKPEDIPTIAREGGPAVSVRATSVVVEAMHAKGIRVMHHITSTFCTKAYLDAHPDWAQRDARTSEPAYFNLYGGLWMLCPNNPQFRADFFKHVTDFTRQTGVDGWMVDEVELLPNWYSCGCQYCRKKFHKETGFTLPADRNSPVWENFDDPTWRAWLRFRMKTCGDFFVDLKAALDVAAPNQVFTGCVAGASEIFLPQFWAMDAAELGRAANFPFYEAWAPKASPFYSWRRFTAEMLLYVSIARPHGTPPLTLFYPPSPAEMPVGWALCNVAGSRLWTQGRGEPGFAPDQGGFFQWESKHDNLLGPQREIAETALLFSKQTRDATFAATGETLERYTNTPRNKVSGRDMSNYVNEWLGWAETLVEANAPFAVIRDTELTARSLAPYKALILPDARCLSDKQAQTILAFAKRGGRLITNGDPASRTDTGALRKSNTLSQQLRSAGTYLDDLPGSRSLIGYVFEGTLWTDPRDPTTLRAIKSAAANALSNPPWTINAPTGVVGRAYRLDRGGAVNFHLLNLSATATDLGTTLAEAGKLQPRYNSVEGIRLKLRANLAPKNAAKWAHWSSPDGDNADIPLVHQGEYLEVEVPKLSHYGVLRISSPSRETD